MIEAFKRGPLAMFTEALLRCANRQPEQALFEPLPKGKFKLLYLDPPWAFRTFSGANKTPTMKRNFSAVGDHYETVDLEGLKQLDVGSIADRDSVLVMWVVGSHLDQAIELGKQFGFDYVTDLFWWLKTKMRDADQIDLFTGDVPEPKLGMGYYTRSGGEFALLFKKGRGLPVLSHAVRKVIVEPAREHSRKPESAYDRLAELFGDVARVELFSRSNREGWVSWGNEVEKFANDDLLLETPALQLERTGQADPSELDQTLESVPPLLRCRPSDGPSPSQK